MKMTDETKKRNTPPCPVCWHRESMRVRRNGGDARDMRPEEHMEWHRPYGGARGQQVTRWDCGHWRCCVCDASFTPDDAAILLDAVLRQSRLQESEVDNWITKAWEGGGKIVKVKK